MKARLAALACTLALSPGAASAGEASLPTHCRAHEYALVNARLGPILTDKKSGRMSFSGNGKLASLCADRPQEPFGSLAYRYGKPGKVEFERVASKAAPFSIHETQIGNVGSDIVFFSKGNVSYYISIAIGQGHGVGVAVFDGGKRVANLFSGNEEGADFELGPASMRFDTVASPVFQLHKPPHRLN